MEDTDELFDYSQYTNRQLAVIPFAVLIIALVIIAGMWLMTGTPANLGIEFTGGTEIQIETTTPQAEIPNAFEEDVTSIRPVLTDDNSYILTFQSADVGSLETQAENAGYTVTSAQSISASFGTDTQLLAVIGVIVAFTGMSIIVFIMFRTFIPSVAIVISAFSDMMIPLALMNLFNIQLSLGTVAALLMIIGYSVDSDILLNNHILRRAGSFYESGYEAIRTGVTMTLTSLTAVTIMTVTAYAFGISLLSAIGIVLIFGLLADLMNTYLLNFSLLRWYRKVDI